MTARVQPDPIHDQLMERVTDWFENALDPQSAADAVRRVLLLAKEAEHQALRWEDQLMVPTWVVDVREACAQAFGFEGRAA